MPDRRSYSMRELDHFFKEFKDDIHQMDTETKEKLDEIHKQTLKTNGRVDSLELWRSYIAGAIAVITVILIPVALKFLF